MKPIFNSPSELSQHFGFVPKTKYDDIRLAKAWHMYVINFKGDGCMGCIAEILSTTEGSKKTTISNTGKIDTHIKLNVNGHIYYVTAERKTNGGRLETIESEFSKAETIEGRYVIYSLDIMNSSTSNKRRLVPAVVIPRKRFIEKLIELNAIKAINKHGVIDGFGIQSSSKAWYNWLLDYPIVYDRNAVYCEDDFEGL